MKTAEVDDPVLSTSLLVIRARFAAGHVYAAGEFDVHFEHRWRAIGGSFECGEGRGFYAASRKRSSRGLANRV
jgi:hypothetical protein